MGTGKLGLITLGEFAVGHSLWRHLQQTSAMPQHDRREFFIVAPKVCVVPQIAHVRCVFESQHAPFDCYRRWERIQVEERNVKTSVTGFASPDRSNAASNLTRWTSRLIHSKHFVVG